MRTGSTVLDMPEIPILEERVKQLESANSNLLQEKAVLDGDISKLENICGKLRLRCNSLESQQIQQSEAILNAEQANDQLGKTLSQSRGECDQLRQLLTEKQAEEVERPVVKPIVRDNFTDPMTPRTCSECQVYSAWMANSEQTAARYLESAKACEKLGDLVNQLTEERNALRLGMKKQKSHLVSLKNLQAENEALKAALKERHPNTAFALLSNTTVNDEDLFEEKVCQLEAKIVGIDQQWARRVEGLRAQHEQIKTGYEVAIRGNSVGSEVGHSVTTESSILREQVKILESRIESIKNYYLMKLKKTSQPILPQTSPHHHVLCKTSLVSLEFPPEVTLSHWHNMLTACLDACNREHLSAAILQTDSSQLGLTSRSNFAHCLAPHVARPVLECLIDTYAYGDEQIDCKTFLSDLATRAGVFVTDLEAENRTLRTHVKELMTELNDKIRTIESGELLETLEIANEQLLKKENQLMRLKLQTAKYTKTPPRGPTPSDLRRIAN